MERNTFIGGRNIMSAVLSMHDFRRLSGFISSECGIKMPDAKKVMLEARLRKRLRWLGLGSFEEYCDYLFSPEGMANELIHMIDVVTTNKTDFFREPRHFDYLVEHVLPDLIGRCGSGLKRKLKVWSAGCSTGEEPYTIAMVLSEFREKCPSFDFSIEATDISTKVLEKASRGVYAEEKIATVPPVLKKKYVMVSKDRNKRLVRVAPELRVSVRFRRLNFMEDDFDIDAPVDIIFCRNVIIYFDKQTQERLLNHLCGHLIPGGYIFTGHSETLSGLNTPLVTVGPMVYKKPL